MALVHPAQVSGARQHLTTCGSIVDGHSVHILGSAWLVAALLLALPVLDLLRLKERQTGDFTARIGLEEPVGRVVRLHVLLLMGQVLKAHGAT